MQIKVIKVEVLDNLWRKVRGIDKPKYWRMPCARCGFTGLAHYSIRGLTDCIRFAPIEVGNGK